MRKETLESPVSGIISRIAVSSNSFVEENQLILSVEVMKLFYDVTCGISGHLTLIVNEGAFVAEGQELGTILEN